MTSPTPRRWGATAGSAYKLNSPHSTATTEPPIGPTRSSPTSRPELPGSRARSDALSRKFYKLFFVVPGSNHTNRTPIIVGPAIDLG